MPPYNRNMWLEKYFLSLKQRGSQEVVSVYDYTKLNQAMCTHLQNHPRLMHHSKFDVELDDPRGH